MKKIVILYNLFLSLIITVVGVVTAKSPIQIVVSLLFLPIAIYFTILLFKKRSKDKVVDQKKYSISPITLGGRTISVPFSKPKRFKSSDAIEPEVLSQNESDQMMRKMGISDANRRVFLKFIGTSSLTMLIFAIFTKKAQAAFFGSIPGPGTVSIKDSAGTTIDPAEKSPTDGYEVAEIDETTADTYYGFTHTDGSWYITKEDSTGSYRYVRGTTDFTTNWTGRISLTYDYYDTVFT
jgi:Ca2+/Na+ antiporter